MKLCNNLHASTKSLCIEKQCQTILILKSNEALNLAEKTRNELSGEKIEWIVVLQNCKTICRYLGRLDDHKWINFELEGYPAPQANSKNNKHGVPRFRLVRQVFYDVYDRRVQFGGELAHLFHNQPIYNSIAEILEYRSKGMNIVHSHILNNLNDQKFRTECGILNHEPPISHGLVPKGELAKIIIGVQNKIYEFLDTVILELKYGNIPETIFTQIRQDVDSELRKHCPAAIAKITFLYEQLETGDLIVYSQIAGTCRQAIKDVANVLFPAQDESYTDTNGKKLSVKDDKPINRILARIDSDSEQKVLKSMHDYTVNFLHALQKYASKGDHSLFTKSDATRCIIYTYFLLGDILHYYTKHEEQEKL